MRLGGGRLQINGACSKARGATLSIAGCKSPGLRAIVSSFSRATGDWRRALPELPSFQIQVRRIFHNRSTALYRVFPGRIGHGCRCRAAPCRNGCRRLGRRARPPFRKICRIALLLQFEESNACDNTEELKADYDQKFNALCSLTAFRYGDGAFERLSPSRVKRSGWGRRN